MAQKSGSIFRSEEMTLCDFFVQPEAGLLNVIFYKLWILKT